MINRQTVLMWQRLVMVTEASQLLMKVKTITLPKVPVPPLEQTMADYIRALEPVTTPAQLERTKAIIQQFTAPNGLGLRLHQYLVDKREAEDNWVRFSSCRQYPKYFQWQWRKLSCRCDVLGLIKGSSVAYDSSVSDVVSTVAIAAVVVGVEVQPAVVVGIGVVVGVVSGRGSPVLNVVATVAYYYWLNDMYMDVRLALPINSNPGMAFPPRQFTTVHDVARFSAQLLDGIMLHKELLDSGKLPQERATSREKNQPLCMAQYYRLLGSCRRPGIERDSQYLPQRTSDDEHVIVFCRNQMYCVILKGRDRGKLSESEIASQILYILSDAPCLSSKPPPLGLLTAEPRSQWAQDRTTILLSERNQRNIGLLETALIVLCLDEPLPLDFNARNFHGATPSVHYAGQRDETNMAHQMIHGGGSEYNSGNRWFDKTMQIIICTDGTWGLCYEHSTSEGIAVVQLLEKIYKKILENPMDSNGVPQHHLPPPERLEWDLTLDIQRRFAQAAVSFDKSISDLDFHVYRYKGYGKNFIKGCQVSPDAYIQLSLQLAYFRLYGYLVTTYESASTRRFLLGRVDCIRSASTEALEWAKAMCHNKDANTTIKSNTETNQKDRIRELFRCAVARQTEVMVQNILGNGIDIPLLGLREASREVTGQLHELFTDESYKISQCFLLSTSQVACSTDSFMGYGPVTPRGYGCSYNPHPDQIVFCVSAFLACGETSASSYAKSLQDSLDIMKDLLEN
uniref:Choline O-acetyltransferase n=1 Tax=Glossina brevipalpis TaxID=37001 RepID=A0A1A9W5V2_9MUSC